MVDFTGTPGNDTITGTPFDDLILGLEGGDNLNGAEGDDVISGGAGNDIITGGLGSDTMSGNDGIDTFIYTNGVGAESGESIDGGAGNDKIVVVGAATFDLKELDVLSIEEIEFDADGLDKAKTIQLESSQFDDPTKFSSTLLIDGNSNDGSDDTIEITMTSGVATLDISGWTFQDWNPESLGGVDVDRIIVTGTSASETIITTSTDDEVHGGFGGDVITTNDGNDLIFGGSDADTIHAGDGHDIIEGGFYSDTIFGGNGDDLLRVLEGEYYDNSHGGDGIDTLDHSGSEYSGNVFDFENETIVGEGTDDEVLDLTGIEIYLDGSGANTIISSGSGEYFGNAGADLMESGNQDLSGSLAEEMDGGADIDTIDHTAFGGTYEFDMTTGLTNFAGEIFTNFENVIMGAGNDTVIGNSADNEIHGGDGVDALYGNDGDDTLSIGLGAAGHIVDGGNGSDTIDFTFSSAPGWKINLAAGTTETDGINYATLISIENATGSGGNDTIIADAGSNILSGGDGDDLLKGRKGADTLNGGNGADTLIGNRGRDTLNGDAGNDLLKGRKGNDTLFGGDGDDRLVGNKGSDTLNGDNGDDTLIGGRGNDILIGGAGADSLTGGRGKDVFVFGAGDGTDVIQDFKNGVDMLDLSAFGFVSNAEAKSHFFERGSASNNVVGFEFDGVEIKIKGVDLRDISGADFII